MLDLLPSYEQPAVQQSYVSVVVDDDLPVLGIQLDGSGQVEVYEVGLLLDGGYFNATATWPDDLDPECDPCAALTFDPPLPALR